MAVGIGRRQFTPNTLTVKFRDGRPANLFKITKYTYSNDSVSIDWVNGAGKESVTVFAEFIGSISTMAQQQKSADRSSVQPFTVAVSGRRQVCGRGIRRRGREFALDRALRRPAWRGDGSMFRLIFPSLYRRGRWLSGAVPILSDAGPKAVPKASAKNSPLAGNRTRRCVPVWQNVQLSIAEPVAGQHDLSHDLGRGEVAHWFFQRDYAAPVKAESPPLLSSMLFLRSRGEGL